MFVRLLSIEIRKTLKHPAFWAGLGGLFFLLAMFAFGRHLQIANEVVQAPGGLEQDVFAGLSFYNWIGVLVYSVTASVIAAYDFPERSIQIWLIRGIPRSMLLLARLTVILLFGLLMACFAMFAILGLAMLSRTLFVGPIEPGSINLAAFTAAVLPIFWSSVPYLALTALLAIISHSPIFAMAGTIIFASVVEPLLGRLQDHYPAVIQYLPARLAQILQARTSGMVMAAGSMSEAQAILSVAAIFIILSSIALIVFSRQDLGG